MSLAACLTAADVGPFSWQQRIFDGTPATIARDGSIESATLADGDDGRGFIDVDSWSGDRQSGAGGGLGGSNLRGDPGRNYFVGLTTQWAIREGNDAAGTFVHFTRFQQDAKLMFGFVDISAHPLPGDLDLDQAMPNARIVVVLPWRWVQGGGSSYQNGFHSGNPLSSGVWSVPAGQSLRTAQTSTANRLANLAGLLAEIPPHAHGATCKLQLIDELAQGRWQLRIDIDDDGVVDRDITSEDAGNARLPAPMSEDSGLVVTTFAAQGVPAGNVGRTSARLAYRESSSAAIETPVNRRPLTAEIPATSKVSPASVVARLWSSAHTLVASSASNPGGVGAVNRLGNEAFVELGLLADGSPTSIALSQSGSPPTVVAGEVRWVPVDLFHNESVTIRAGDSILLTYLGACGPGETVAIDADGNGTIDFTGVTGDQWPRQYPTPGVFTAKVFKNGTQVGSATVTVVSALLPTTIAAQVGFARQVDINTGATPASAVDVVAANPADLTVAVVQRSGNRLRCTVKPLRRGTPVMEVRLTGPGSPLLAARAIDEFTLESAAALATLIDHERSQGTTRITMRPHIPDLTLTLDMFASRAAFAGGVKTFAAATDGFALAAEGGETIGVLRFDLVVPFGETSYCFRGTMTQIDPNPGPVAVGATGAINGKDCRATVDKVDFCIPADGPKNLVVTVTQQVDGGTNHHAVIVGGGPPAKPFFVPSTSATSQGTVNCKKGDPATLTESVNPGTTPGKFAVQIKDTVFADRIVVRRVTSRTLRPAPDGTAATRKKVGVAEQVEFTADVGNATDNAATTWTASKGSPATATGAAFTWTATGEAEPAVVITGTIAGHACVLDFVVIEPNQAQWTSRTATAAGYTAGNAGAQMTLGGLTISPRDVNFARIEVNERSGPPSNVQGYFATNPPFTTNAPAAGDPAATPPVPATAAGIIFHAADGGSGLGNGPFLTINDTNVANATDTAGIAPPGLAPGFRPGGFVAGSFTWVIPYAYRVVGAGGNGKVFDDVNQVFTIAANGTVTVTKDDAATCTVTRATADP